MRCEESFIVFSLDNCAVKKLCTETYYNNFDVAREGIHSKSLPPSLGQLMLDCLLMAILQYCMFDAWSPGSPLRFHLPGALEEISSSKIL